MVKLDEMQALYERASNGQEQYARRAIHHGTLINRREALLNRFIECWPTLRDEVLALRNEKEQIREALAGSDFASLPSDLPTVRMAHDVRAERDKFMWQVRDTCQRAEKAEGEVLALRQDKARLDGMEKQLLRKASMRFDDGTFKAVNAWSIASAGTNLREALDTALAGGEHG